MPTSYNPVLTDAPPPPSIAVSDANSDRGFDFGFHATIRGIAARALADTGCRTPDHDGVVDIALLREASLQFDNTQIQSCTGFQGHRQTTLGTARFDVVLERTVLPVRMHVVDTGRTHDLIFSQEFRLMGDQGFRIHLQPGKEYDYPHAKPFRLFGNQRQVVEEYLTKMLELGKIEPSCSPFLGHLISGDSVKPNPAKVAIIQKWPEPTGPDKLHSFLALCNYLKGRLNVADPISRAPHLATVNADPDDGREPS